jgi:hypothetical protein
LIVVYKDEFNFLFVLSLCEIIDFFFQKYLYVTQMEQKVRHSAFLGKLK